MKYVAIFLGAFAVATLASLLLALIVQVSRFVIEEQLWWLPAALGISLMVAVLAASIEYLTDHPGEDEGQQ